MKIKKISVLMMILVVMLLSFMMPLLTVYGHDSELSPETPLSVSDNFFAFLPMAYNLMYTTIVPTEEPTSTVEPTTTVEPSVTPSPSITVSPTPGTTRTPLPDGVLVVDSTSIELFDQIPDSYIQAASQIPMIFWHASVGYNISYGLDCMADNYDPRPNGCDREIPPENQIADPKYNRDNWDFEFHQPPPEQNPGWWEKIALFVERVDALPIGSYDVVAYKHGYVDAYEGSLIDDVFFNNDPNDAFMSVEDLIALEGRHPDKTVVYWTMSIARLSFPDSENFNVQMRDFAISNDKILMDIADITSHLPDGTPCYSILNNGVEAICDEYTSEEGGGHLNAISSQRMSKAVWVLMAFLAGWDGNP